MRKFLPIVVSALAAISFSAIAADMKAGEKATKTDNPREMPVHPTLAKVLAEWKLEGFERFVGRKPKPEDLIVPALPKFCV